LRGASDGAKQRRQEIGGPRDKNAVCFGCGAERT
jgi:hypothetical protein